MVSVKSGYYKRPLPIEHVKNPGFHIALVIKYCLKKISRHDYIAASKGVVVKS